MIFFVYVGTLPTSGPAFHDPDPLLKWDRMTTDELRALANKRAPVCCKCAGAYVLNNNVKTWIF